MTVIVGNLGKRQRLAVLRQTVNLFPSGKQWWFDSTLSHEPMRRLCMQELRKQTALSRGEMRCAGQGGAIRRFGHLVQW